MEYRPNFKATPLDCVRGNTHLYLKSIYFRITTEFFYGVGIKRLNTGLALNITEFAANNCFFILDLSPEQCNNSHIHG